MGIGSSQEMIDRDAARIKEINEILMGMEPSDPRRDALEAEKSGLQRGLDFNRAFNLVPSK